MKPDEPRKKSEDLVFLHSPTDDGEGVRAVRARPGRLDLAELRPVAEGCDVSHSEVVRLVPREEAPRICDVDVLYRPEQQPKERGAEESKDHGGPRSVATESYRKNWDRIFGLKKPRARKNYSLN